MDVGDEHQQAGQRLLGRDAELGRLLDGVGGVGTGVGETDHLRAGGWACSRKEGEVRAREGVGHRTGAPCRRWR